MNRPEMLVSTMHHNKEDTKKSEIILYYNATNGVLTKLTKNVPFIPAADKRVDG